MLFYKTKAEAQNQIDFVKSLGKSELLGLDSAIEVDPAGPVQEKEGWTFFYFPLTRAEAEAAKLAAEAKLGRKDAFTVERSERAQSFFIQPRCPDAAPDETGWTRWAACFTESEATRQVKKLRDAHIEAKTGRLQKDRYYVLFQPLTEPVAKAKGAAEAKTRGGFAEGMLTAESKATKSTCTKDHSTRRKTPPSLTNWSARKRNRERAPARLRGLEKPNPRCLTMPFSPRSLLPQDITGYPAAQATNGRVLQLW